MAWRMYALYRVPSSYICIYIYDQVEALISIPGGEMLDMAVLNLPVMKEMGDNITITCKAVKTLS